MTLLPYLFTDRALEVSLHHFHHFSAFFADKCSNSLISLVSKNGITNVINQLQFGILTAKSLSIEKTTIALRIK